MTDRNELREKLARLAHEQWSGWMEYLFAQCQFNEDGTVTIPASFALRWHRQMNTQYYDLSESEKESDRREADKILATWSGK